ncbi:TetR/AcrR family transcriptional regulator [Nocardia crassostreae]|uniref:TetR/AcrR family transcriptional regulator n=1 Tax=Nocardia crassostreae TaxID=53428 RepID=UPI000831A726|nr:TetR/AcrR family transcriptional regulator [Nocardia crassostreae]
MGDGTRSAGRPRDTDLDRQLLVAAQHLLAESGYDKLTMDAVAARAGAGKTSVYRRWKSKSALVIDAIRDLLHFGDPPDTGTLRGDLLAMGGFQQGNPLRHRILTGLVTATTREPAIRDALTEVADKPSLASFATIAARARDRGEIPDTDRWQAIVEIIPAVVFYRTVIRDQPLDEEFFTHLVDDILIPLLTAQP